MVKTVLGGAHRGLRDWIIQRISAVYMGLYTLILAAYIVLHPQLTFLEWRNLFVGPYGKILTLFFLLGLLVHTWVGVWTVLTDYVKFWVLRLFLELALFFMLSACFVWGLDILWSVD